MVACYMYYYYEKTMIAIMVNWYMRMIMTLMLIIAKWSEGAQKKVMREQK
jgi:hypothetical protein